MSGEQKVAVIAEILPCKDRRCIIVAIRSNDAIPMKSTIEALEDLASQLREQFKIEKPKPSGLILASR